VERAAAGSEHLRITGESGTGKERLARAYHAAGPQAQGPFVAVNCAAIPESLAERLLFGATRGTYTGADADAAGYIAAADGGTLFLDEVGELAPQVQAKLLRVLESHEVLALGASRPRRVRTRFCFATLASLRDPTRFRPDLYFRIAQSTIEVPPLRERVEEIPWLVCWQLARLGNDVSPHPRFIERCLLRPWPGNVRELLAAVRRAFDVARTAGEAVLGATHLEEVMGGSVAPPAGSDVGGGAPTPTPAPAPARGAESAELMRGAILAALEQTNWRVSGERGAARLLGLRPTTLESRMKQLGITRPHVTRRDPDRSKD
jgi:transcriptional regulator with GAF, ATPase, and Fis domain